MDRQRLFAQLRLHEGVERKPYQCSAGYLTIGVGRNIEERGLSDDEIDYILNNDVNIATDELVRTFDWMMDSRWASQVGQRSERLRDMMESGEDSSDFGE